MSTPTSSARTGSSTSTWVGIVLGIVILGLMAAFAIGLPKAHGEEEGASAKVDLTLPDQLPGGYLAADDPASFKGGQLEAQAKDIADQQAAARAYGDKVLPQVLGTSAVTRTYVANGTDAVFVQAFQSTGGAFAPNSLPDPQTTGGQTTTDMKKVGDGACILSYSQAGAQAPAFSQCQVTRGDVTVQVGSGAVAAKDLVALGDDLLGELTGK